MTKLADHQSAKTTKMLLIGDPGSGKTGALVSLAKAGYNLRIIDLDNGLDVVANLLKGAGDAEALGRVEFETITDKMKSSKGRLVPGQATVWNRTIKLLEDWSTESAKLGPITSWGTGDVLVIDSLSMLASAAMNFQLFVNGRIGGAPQQSDWYQGQMMLESLIQMLFDEAVACNVIINCHVAFIGEEGGPQRGYPATLGKALSPKIGAYFNTILMVKTMGQGAQQKRKILTGTTGLVELKNSAPTRVKGEYDQATGLAEFFRDVRGAQAPKTEIKI